MAKKKPELSMRDLERETEKFLKPATQKEKDILDAAVELLGERGVDGATTAEIARRANVTERTLFRYFPSKRDLVRRVLFPLIFAGGMAQQWKNFEGMLQSTAPDLKTWYAAVATNRLATQAKRPALVRTVMMEVADNPEFREAVGKLWYEHIWMPMIKGLGDMQKNGAIRKEVDVEALARVMHFLNVGYFFTRFVFAADHKWDDAAEIDKMAEILAHGASPR